MAKILAAVRKSPVNESLKAGKHKFSCSPERQPKSRLDESEPDNLGTKKYKEKDVVDLETDRTLITPSSISLTSLHLIVLISI